jgi:hypothetical protein
VSISLEAPNSADQSSRHTSIVEVPSYGTENFGHHHKITTESDSRSLTTEHRLK